MISTSKLVEKYISEIKSEKLLCGDFSYIMDEYLNMYVLAVESLKNNDAYLKRNQSKYYINEMFKQLLTQESLITMRSREIIDEANNFLCGRNINIVKSHYSSISYSMIISLIMNLSLTDMKGTIRGHYSTDEFVHLLSAIDYYHQKYNLTLTEEELNSVEKIHKPNL